MIPHAVTISDSEAAIDVNCFLCKTEHHFILNKDNYIKWQTGTLIQNAFPEMDADTREILISGICGACYDLQFGE